MQTRTRIKCLIDGQLGRVSRHRRKADREGMPEGYVLVCFDDGAELCVHCSNLRAI